MVIDKQNGNVKYNDAEHLYWDDNGKYISVTTLIHQFSKPFDQDFWSAYKAIEKLLTKEEFKLEKKQLLDTKKVDLDYFTNNYEFTKDDFNKIQQNVLDEWQKTNIESCERGTAIHLALEQSFTKHKETDLKKYGLGGKFLVNTNETLEKTNKELLDIEKGVFPEYLVYRKSEDGKFRLAGQIDLLIKDGNDIYIRDYKSNRKLDSKSFFDSKTKKNSMMKYPLNNLMDCNMIHYTLQLSTYAWMLQQINPEFKIKSLILEHHDHNGNIIEHEVDYLKNDVIRMCKWYKKQLLLKEKQDSRKPIEF